MKKDFLLVLFLLLLILPAISAVQIDMKSNFSQDETLIAQISGNFLGPIQEQNVLLYQGYVRVSFLPTINKIDDNFYVYGQLFGKSSGNYSLVISGVDYFESGITKDNDTIRNFTITNSKADFSINPGFLKSAGNFSIDAQNLADKTITVNSSIKNSTAAEDSGFFSFFGASSANSNETETQISPGRTKSISFSSSNFENNTLIYAVLETNNTHYEVPVLISGNETPEKSQISFEFQPSHREVSLATNSSTFIYLYLYNSGKENLTNVSLSVSDSLKPYISISNETLHLNSNSSIRITADISSGSKENITEGLITAKYKNETSEFILALNFSKNYLPSGNETPLFQTCSELGGKFCSEGQTCSTSLKNAKDGACCVGTCQSPSNSGKILGWTLAAILVLLVVVFFVWRYMKARRPFNLLDFAKKK